MTKIPNQSQRFISRTSAPVKNRSEVVTEIEGLFCHTPGEKQACKLAFRVIPFPAFFERFSS